MTNPLSAHPVSLLADLDFVRRLARQLCGDEHTAEDVAQETMVTALERPPKSGNRRGWLATVARNLAYRQHRGSRRRAAREQAVSREISEPSSEEVVAREQVRTAVVQAVLELPDEQRQIILLRFYQGVPVADCSHQLGITASAVRSRAARAVARLRARLDAKHGGERGAWAALLLPFATPSVRVRAATAVGVRRSAWLMLAAVLVVGVAWMAASAFEDPAVPAIARASVAGAPDAADPPDAGQPQVPAAPPELPERKLPERKPAVAQDPQQVLWTARGVVHVDEGMAEGARIQSWLSLGGSDVADWVALPDQKSDADGGYEIPLAELETWSELARAHATLVVLHSLAGYRSDQVRVRCDDVMRSPTKNHVKARLYAGSNVRARLLRSDGSPAANLHMRGVTAERTYNFETFADGSFQAFSPGGKVLIACGDGGHGQFLQVVDVGAGQLVDLGEVRLDDKGPFLEGTARYPDGTPLANIPVSLSDEPGPETMEIEAAGFTFPNDVVLTRRPLVRSRQTRTDAFGKFRLLHAGRGGYSLTFGNGSYFRKEFQLGAEGPHHLDVTFESRVANAHIRVIAQDEDGRVLHEATVKAFLWNGDKAPVARARYDQEGVTEDLLATARRRSNRMNNRSHEPLLMVRNDLFALIEVSLGGAKTVCVPCELPVGRHEATVRVILAPPGRTAPLHVEATTTDGETVARLFVKLRQQGAPQESSCKLSANPPRGGASAGIQGAWHAVPASGRLEVPFGIYDLELLAGAHTDRGRILGSGHPITHHLVRLARDEAATLQVVLPAGERMLLSVSLPRGFDAKGLSMLKQKVTLTPRGGGPATTMLFWPRQGDRINDGAVVLEAEQGLAAGSYQLTWKPRSHRIIKDPDPNAAKPLRMEGQNWQAIDQVVELKLQRTPFPLQLVLQED